MAKKIYFDAGHGGSDPGACANGLKEKDLAIKVVKAAVAYMKANYVCDVYQDITADSLNTICARSNKWGADLFVSVHFNAGGNGKADGYEALVYSSSSNKLGKTFEKRVKAIGQNSRGIKYRPDLAVLRLTDCKSILNECAFIDNKKDIKDWDEDSELKKMGEALAKAAADYLKLSTKKPKKQTVPFKVKAKCNLVVREKSILTSKKLDKIAKKGEIYTITKVIGNRGQLKTGGWITITDKYVKIV